ARSLSTLDPADCSYLIACAQQAGAVWFRPEGGGWIVDRTDEASMRVAEYWDEILAAKIIGTSYGAFSTPWMAAAGEGDVLATISGRRHPRGGEQIGRAHV